MKKYFLSFFVFIFLFLFLGQSQLVFAVPPPSTGNNYTWKTDNKGNPYILVSGQNLSGTSQLYVPGNSGSATPLWPGDIAVKNSTSKGGYCFIVINNIILGNNGASATLTASNSAFGGPVDNACPANIISQYNNLKIAISGTPPKESAQGKQTQIEYDYSGANPPGSITVKLTQQNCKTDCVQEQTAKKGGNSTCSATYKYTFSLDAGTYTFCAGGTSCQNFTKQADVPLTKKFGDMTPLNNINAVLVVTKESWPSFDKSVYLKQSDKIIKTTSFTQNKVQPPNSRCYALTATFQCMAPGSYSLCLTKDNNDNCQQVTQGNSSLPDFDFNGSIVDQNMPIGQYACSYAPTPTSEYPPPPSPPCSHWVNGECASFLTAFGTFSTSPAGFVTSIFSILLSVSGGVALLLIIRAGYVLISSRGNPEQIKEGRDQLIAAVVGLVFLIFSFVFLQLIGFDILHLPGFTQ